MTQDTIKRDKKTEFLKFYKAGTTKNLLAGLKCIAYRKTKFKDEYIFTDAGFKEHYFRNYVNITKDLYCTNVKPLGKYKFFCKIKIDSIPFVIVSDNRLSSVKYYEARLGECLDISE